MKMKIFAMREKGTGKLAGFNNGKWELEPYRGEIGLASHERYYNSTLWIASKILDTELELITLRIEPTEPCEWCGDDIGGSIHRPNNGQEKAWRKDAVRVSLGYYHFNFCPNCGRSLT